MSYTYTFTRLNIQHKEHIMGILDSIAGRLGGKSTDFAHGIAGLLGGGAGLSGLVTKLTASGLGDIVNSWVGTGANSPITPEQITKGLGPDVIKNIASRAGVSHNDAASMLANHLPDIVDKLTPGGKLPQNDIAGSVMKLLGLK